MEEYNLKRGVAGEQSLDAMTLCARTDSEVVVGAYDKVSAKFKNNDDIWLVPIEIAMKGQRCPSKLFLICPSKFHFSDDTHHRICRQIVKLTSSCNGAEDNSRVGVEGTGALTCELAVMHIV